MPQPFLVAGWPAEDEVPGEASPGAAGPGSSFLHPDPVLG